jgi:hypothetical protein
MNDKLKELKELIDRERWALAISTDPDENKDAHNISVGRIETKVRELLPPLMKPEFVKACYVTVQDGNFFQHMHIPQHHECPKCGLWLMRDYRVCSRGCCTIDWSEGGEA